MLVHPQLLGLHVHLGMVVYPQPLGLQRCIPNFAAVFTCYSDIIYSTHDIILSSSSCFTVAGRQAHLQSE